MQRVLGQPAFVLHTRPFRETSLLLELLTPDFGRMSGLSRGARSGKRGAIAVRPFVYYQASWSGRGELVNVHRLEPMRLCRFASTRDMLCALYLNELLIRLTARGNPSPGLFSLYDGALSEVSLGESLEPVLRRFEAELLRALGYEISIGDVDASGRSLNPEGRYAYDLEDGTVRICDESAGRFSVSGRALLALRSQDFSSRDTAAELKKFFRRVLDHHLQEKTVYTRKIMQRLSTG